MTTTEASSEIKKFIEQTYEVEFKGKVEVVNLDEDTHVLRLILNSFYVPLNITVQGTMEEFLENVKDKSTKSIENFFKKGSFKELDELLNFKWNKEDLEELIKKGIKIEVFLGQNDKIIDSLAAKEFFKEFATVYYFKDKGHLL